MEKELCFVDEDLRVVSDRSKIKAFVNQVGYKSVEVLFLEPIGKEKDKIEASNLIREWRTNYPGYRTTFPNYQTCELYNRYNYPEIIKNCYTANLEYEQGFQKTTWTAIMDNLGVSKPVGSRKGIMENVYVSVIMPLRYFQEINPNISLQEYLSSPVPM